MITLSGQAISTAWVNTPEVYNPATSAVDHAADHHPGAARGAVPTDRRTAERQVLAISAEHGGVMTFDPATKPGPSSATPRCRTGRGPPSPPASS